MHPQPALRPVDVVQFEPDDLPCAQPKPCQQQQDGPIPEPCWRTPRLALVQEPANALRRHRPGDRRHRPSGDARNDRGKVRLDVVAIAREAEEGAQRGDDVLGLREGAVARCIAPDIVCDLAAADVGETRLINISKACQKAPYVPGVILDRGRRETAFLLKPARIFHQYGLDPGGHDRSAAVIFNDASISEPTRDAAQRCGVATLGTATPGAVAQERLLMTGSNLARSDGFLAQPSLNSLMKKVLCQ
ncbi:MAG TPA: hypothetical protein VHE81_09420 [Lacipirellulaceae bacterium]|nr:hypothetical protein [Lacipirellulaceae bacterium]